MPRWTDDHREARRVAKEAKRAANREAWSLNRLNANHQRQETLAAVVPEIPADPASEGGSLAKMRSIMADTAAPLYRRLDAAEVILTYELAPGSAVGVPAEQIAATSYRFLTRLIRQAA